MQLAFQCWSRKVRTIILVRIHMGPAEYFFVQYILAYLHEFKVGYIALHITMLFLSNLPYKRDYVKLRVFYQSPLVTNSILEILPITPHSPWEITLS